MKNRDMQNIKEFMKTIGYEINPNMEKHCSFKIEINNCKETSYYFRKANATNVQKTNSEEDND